MSIVHLRPRSPYAGTSRHSLKGFKKNNYANMYSYAMVRIAKAFFLNRTLSQVLTPTTVGFSCKAAQFYSKHISGHRELFASAVVARFPPDKTINGSLHANRTLLNELKAGTLSDRCRDPNVWVALLDLYLPEYLRDHQNEINIDVTKDQTVRDIKDFPLILEQARREHPSSLDLFSYLGIHQKRWKAVLWLTKVILDQHLSGSYARESRDKLKAPFWPDIGMSLRELGRDPIWADDIIKPVEPSALDHETLCKSSQSMDVTKAPLVQVWQSIACMLLQAADRQEGTLESKVIMFHVFRILAHMHQINAIPASIYMKTQVKHRFMVQRPPTLNLYSSRISAILSDASRIVHDLEMASQSISSHTEYPYKEHDFFGGSWQHHWSEVNISIWLDLVLWSCIEGGWIREAAWIANEIDSRRADKERNWSVIRWETLKEQKISQTNSVVKTAQENAKSHVNQITTDPALANSDGESSLVNVPSRTISREVILALLDGLASLADAIGSDSNRTEAVQLYISACKRLLATEGSGLETHILNCIIVRLVEGTGRNVMQRPRELERILHLSPIQPKEIEASMSQISAHSLVQRLGFAYSAVWLGLLHHNLFLFAKSGDVNGALRTFYKLQCFMDDNRRQLIQNFVETVANTDDPSKSAEGINMIFLSRIPIHVLARLFSLVSDAKFFEFGKWLLYSNDIDGATIPPELYSHPTLQPALLRFAADTSDMELQWQLTEKLSKPLSLSVLRALLHCRISLGKWDSAEQLMLYIRDNKEVTWNPSDAMIIAKAILLLEKDSLDQNSAQSESLRNAFTLLQKVLGGEYISVVTYNDRYTRTKEFRKLNQLFRMLKTCPGILSNLISTSSENIGPAMFPTRIKVDAFNHLVEGVVERDGSAAGKKLWELWCFENNHESSVPSERLMTWQRLDLESVVEPNLQTLRIILRPINEAKRDIPKIRELESEKLTTSKDSTPLENKQSRRYQSKTDKATTKRNIVDQGKEREIVQWACDIFRKTFGLSPEEIRNEFREEVWLPDF